MTLVNEDERLRRWIAYVYKDDRCTCDYALKEMRGYGRGWVRLTTEPGCPHHGAARLSLRGEHRLDQVRRAVLVPGVSDRP
jgi:hypothetical protein